MIIHLPYPPSINHYWLRTARGMRLSDKARAYRQECLGLIKAYEGERPDPKALVKVWLRVCPPDKRKRDLDNIIKPVLDVMQHAGLVEDDSQVVHLAVSKMFVSTGGKIDLEIEEPSSWMDWVKQPLRVRS
jgi:crossover junction endodeoxyribonuclease RusA